MGKNVMVICFFYVWGSMETGNHIQQDAIFQILCYKPLPILIADIDARWKSFKEMH